MITKLLFLLPSIHRPSFFFKSIFVYISIDLSIYLSIHPIYLPIRRIFPHKSLKIDTAGSLSPFPSLFKNFLSSPPLPPPLSRTACLSFPFAAPHTRHFPTSRGGGGGAGKKILPRRLNI